MSKMRASVILAGLAAAGALLPADARAEEVGGASWYALNSRTASGERMNPSALTAAHRSLPFGTMVRVENLNNGRSVVVRINDRGPFVRGRVIDVSRAAASQIGMIGAGVARVKLTVLGRGSRTDTATATSPFRTIAGAQPSRGTPVASRSSRRTHERFAGGAPTPTGTPPYGVFVDAPASLQAARMRTHIVSN